MKAINEELTIGILGIDDPFVRVHIAMGGFGELLHVSVIADDESMKWVEVVAKENL